jgi:hypothetical protein
MLVAPSLAKIRDMLERPPRDDLRVQRIATGVLRVGVVVVVIGAIAITIASTIEGVPLPKNARGWALAILGWVAMQALYGVGDRLFGRFFNVDADGWEQRYRDRREARPETGKRPRRFRRSRPSQLPPGA